MDLTIDYNTFRTGNRFKGIKLTRGLHYIQYQISEQEGFFLNCNTDLIVFDLKNDRFYMETDQDQIERIRLNWQEFETCLGYIEEKNETIWNDLVQFLTLENLMILPNTLCPLACTSFHTENSTISTNAQSTSNDTQYQKDRIAFIEFDLKKSFPVDDLSLRTKYSLDKSFLLHTILCKHTPEYLLGELALSFILFQVAQVYDGFEQWKLLVSLLCHCNEAIPQHTSLFLHFMDLLKTHLEQFPIDFFQDELSSSSFLVESIHTFSINCRDYKELVVVQDRLDSLLGFIDSRFQWNLKHFVHEIEEGEDAPVIVG